MIDLISIKNTPSTQPDSGFQSIRPSMIKTSFDDLLQNNLKNNSFQQIYNPAQRDDYQVEDTRALKDESYQNKEIERKVNDSEYKTYNKSNDDKSEKEKNIDAAKTDTSETRENKSDAEHLKAEKKEKNSNEENSARQSKSGDEKDDGEKLSLADIAIHAGKIKDEDFTKAEESLKKLLTENKKNINADKKNTSDDKNIFMKITEKVLAGENDSQKISKKQLKNIIDEIRSLLTDEKNNKKENTAENKKIHNFLEQLESQVKNSKEKDIRLPVQASELLDMLIGKKNAKNSRDTKSASGDKPHSITLQNDAAAAKIPVKELTASADTAADNGSQNSENKGGSTFHDMVRQESIQKQGSSMQQLKPSNFKDQMQHIINNAKVTVKDAKNGSFSVKLYPRELGNVNVSLGLENGTLNGKFLVETENAKQLLMSNINLFMQQMKDAGIEVGSFDVDVRDNSEKLFQENDKKNGIAGSNNKEEQTAVAMEYNESSSISHNGSINMVI